ncbi:MAG: hypothetical protein HQ564_08680, partial [Candidatus Saganbacteria bacterium]|nr:hypothetical protein [Candidatus Saganbacteria bacterium]
MRFKIVSFDSNKPLESNSFPGMETVLEKIDSLNGNLDQIESYLRSFGFPIAKPLIRNLVRKGTLKDVLKVYLNPPLRVARGMVANTLDVIHSTTLPLEKLLADHPKLLETCRILVREMRERKEDTAFNLFRPNEIGLSPGIEQGRIVSDIEDRRGSREQIIHVAQLAGNHRSVTVVLPLVNGQTTLKLKGAGLSKLLATFGFNRLLFQSNTSFAEKNGLVKPFHVNDYQKGEEASKESLIESMQLNSWTSLVKKRNSFVGGFLLPQAEQETLRSYAMQSLMMMIDQGKGSTASLPLRLDMVNTVVVRRGAVEIRLAAEEYFTSSELLTKGELYKLASEAYVKADADEKNLLGDYIETLRTSNP